MNRVGQGTSESRARIARDLFAKSRRIPNHESGTTAFQFVADGFQLLRKILHGLLEGFEPTRHLGWQGIATGSSAQHLVGKLSEMIGFLGHSRGMKMFRRLAEVGGSRLDIRCRGVSSGSSPDIATRFLEVPFHLLDSTIRLVVPAFAMEFHDLLPRPVGVFVLRAMPLRRWPFAPVTGSNPVFSSRPFWLTAALAPIFTPGGFRLIPHLFMSAIPV